LVPYVFATTEPLRIAADINIATEFWNINSRNTLVWKKIFLQNNWGKSRTKMFAIQYTCHVRHAWPIVVIIKCCTQQIGLNLIVRNPSRNQHENQE
jgi:hypothetical protein